MTLRAAAFVSLLLAVSGGAAGSQPAELTPQQQRGKHLYQTGESAAKRKITALLGADQVEVEARVVPCVSCHGRDGRGRAEGGILPANLQWDVLTHPAKTPDRTRAAYTAPLLKRAIAMGMDASANKLPDTMPRYRMSLEDMDDLLAYLGALGRDLDPGLSDDAVRVGLVLPAGEAEQKAVRDTLTAYFDRVNRDGGVFGRRIDPRFTTTSGTSEARAAALAAFIESEQPFAITAAWLSGADEAMSRAIDKAGVPTIAAFAAHTPASDRYVFRMLTGIREQSLALVAAAAEALGAKPRVAVIGDAPDFGDAVAIAPLETAQAILFLGAPSRLAAVLEDAAARPSPPYVLVPAAHSTGDLTSAPPALDRRILVALPSSPGDITDEGAAELRALGVPPAYATSCRIALASAKLLVDALRRRGRNIDREQLVATLETFYRVPTGLTPPVSWSRSDHGGARQVLIVSLDLQAKRWVDRGWWSFE